MLEERRQKLLEIVRRKGFVALPSLVGEMSVSIATIRRDIEALEEDGAIKKTHGGVYYTGPSPKAPHFDEFQVAEWERKKKIAAVAVQFIREGEVVLIDGGSTAYEVARQLVGRRVQIVTNSLPVANLFASDPTAGLVIVGGVVDPRASVIQGDLACQMLGNVNVNWAVLSVAGVSEKGFYNNNALLVETERAMMQAADQVMIVADSTKFGRQGLAQLCELREVQRIVTDKGLDPYWKKRLQREDIEFSLAE